MTGVTARLRYSFIPFLFDTQIEVDVADVTMHYQTATITQQTKLIQPPAITVDPPPFAFQADGVTDLSAIRGRLTIRGGDSPEVLGDRLIIHNETGSVPAIGSLQTFSQPRYTQIGEDANRAGDLRPGSRLLERHRALHDLARAPRHGSRHHQR